jgi:hypothetical protein
MDAKALLELFKNAPEIIKAASASELALAAFLGLLGCVAVVWLIARDGSAVESLCARRLVPSVIPRVSARHTSTEVCSQRREFSSVTRNDACPSMPSVMARGEHIAGRKRA